MPPCWGYLQRYGALVQRYRALLAEIPGYGVEIYGSFAERLGFFADIFWQRVDTSLHGSHLVPAQLLCFVAGTYLGLQHTAARCNTLQHTTAHCVSTQFHVAVILSQLLRYVAGTYLEHIFWCFLIYMCDVTHSQRRDTLTHSYVWHKDTQSLIHT